MKLIQRGFTLVELLIVVIILAILAAIVIPQFSSATVDAQESALDSNLSALRSAIELYKAQHGGKYPGDVITAATCTGGTKGLGTAGLPQLFIDQMTMYTDASGGTCDRSVTAEKMVLGPYLRKGVPAEPINNKGSIAAEIVMQLTGAPLPVPATGANGWAYDTKSGQIYMNSPANDSKTKAYSTH
ncbi:MAG: type II secretion system protein [Methylotenera sp.]